MLKKRLIVAIVVGVVAWAVFGSFVCANSNCNIGLEDAYGIISGIFISIVGSIVLLVVIPKLLVTIIKLPEKKIKPEITNSLQEQAFLRAIKKIKTEDCLVGLKIGSKELVECILKSLKNEKGVNVESLLAILGSLAGYSCQVACREEIINSEAPNENKTFITVQGVDGNMYYFGDFINKPLIEDKMSIWNLIAGVLQELAVTDIPDIKAIFAKVASSVGSSEFGVPNVDEQHRPGDLPLNYVKALWSPLLPLIDKYCDTPMERPILFGLAIQQVIEMGKDVILPSSAALLVMECAIPMSKIGPEWIETGA